VKANSKELNPEYLSINKVAMSIDVSDHTIARWYKWWDSPEFEKPKDLFLPEYYFKDRRRTKFFKKKDIPYLKEFKNNLQTTHKGSMAEFNAAYQWGKRGEAVLSRKGISSDEVKGKIR